MRNRVGTFLLSALAAVGLTSALPAVAGQQAGSAKPVAASAPAPEHDISGVWNMHAPPAQRRFFGNTWTAEPPEMTSWGSEKYNAAKPSNGPRTHSLKDTDDPVLRQCLPPGTPRKNSAAERKALPRMDAQKVASRLAVGAPMQDGEFAQRGNFPARILGNFQRKISVCLRDGGGGGI